MDKSIIFDIVLSLRCYEGQPAAGLLKGDKPTCLSEKCSGKQCSYYSYYE